METSNGFLLDTHIFLWWMEGRKKFSPKIESILKDESNQVFISVISIWEMIIKSNINKLQLPDNLQEGIAESGFSILQLSLSHVFGLDSLPMFHNDPFDRILIAQTITEKLTLITSDEKIKKYNIPVLFAK
jgi:PIN domain nuclease of toxin-antitoxin system